MKPLDFIMLFLSACMVAVGVVGYLGFDATGFEAAALVAAGSAYGLSVLACARVDAYAELVKMLQRHIEKRER